MMVKKGKRRGEPKREGGGREGKGDRRRVIVYTHKTMYNMYCT